MKKVILLSILVAATQLVGGNKSSKSGKSNQLEAFGGKAWENVYIAPEGNVYTFGNKKLESWNFDGLESTEILYEAQKGDIAQFTDKACYVMNKERNKIVTYPMDGRLKTSLVMTKKIMQLAVSQAGFAPLDKEGSISRFDSNSRPVAGVIKVDDNTGDITLLDTGELLYVHSKGITIFGKEHPKDHQNIPLDVSPKKILRKKTQKGHIVLASQNETVGPAIDIVVVADGTSVLTISTGCYPLDWDLEGNNIAIVGDGSGQNSTVKLFDIENDGKKIYEGNHDISGHRAVRLDGSTIYFVGDKPEPKSLGIDTRQKTNKN